MHTNVNWFELPTKDLTRATRFYETIFDASLRQESMSAEGPMAIFTRANGDSFGCLTSGDWIQPSAQGALVYLDAGPSIQSVIDRIVPAGGKIAMEKTQLPKDIGYIAHFIDTEGNRVALHAMG